MKMKLTEQQLEAMYKFFTDQVINDQPANIAEGLVKSLLMKVYTKLHKKLYAKFIGHAQGYSIQLTDEEGMAYYIYFNKRSYGQNYRYEQILIQSHINELDKQYA